ncbi:MAG TPA: autotransporter-associated beta strand repeat-containing protein [Lacipirellulaceae bacterium]|nr:autotransporter-associated beta strand repeat-containing protein [Lacipirellulaceae bacterium]
MRFRVSFASWVALSAFVLVFILPTRDARAAAERFDVNGTTGGSGVTNGGSYTWEGAGYSSTSAGTDPVPWVEGNFLRLAAGTDAGTSNYTITANSDHSFAGMFLQSGGGGTVTIDGPGVLSINSGLQGVLVNSSTQNLVINAKLSGTGGLENELSGSLFLYGSNDYGGGTQIGTVAGLNFNNDNSFGTGPISWRGLNSTTAGTSVLATPAATSPITIANDVNTTATTQIFVGVPAAPVTFSGSWTLPATGTTTFQNQPAGTMVTISGPISGDAAFKKAGAGTLVLSSSSNSYTGATTVSAGILQLGAASTLADTSSMILGGGTLDPGGLNQDMSATTTLSLIANSTIDYIVGASEIDFANSSALSWTGTLNLANWGSSTKLRVGTDSTGLTPAQLASIEFNGDGLGTARITSAGYVVPVPEPATAVLLLIGALMASFGRRRAR